MIDQPWRVRILVHRMFFSLSVIFAEVLDRDRVRYWRLVPMEETESRYPAPQAARLELNEEHGQQLMDSLWEQGYRPSRGVSSTGQDEAQKAHISDLRDIVRSLLKIEARP